MTADIVNLRQRRKRKERVAKEAEAEENRRRFGRPGAERRHETATKELNTRQLDGHERSKPVDRSDPDTGE